MGRFCHLRVKAPRREGAFLLHNIFFFMSFIVFEQGVKHETRIFFIFLLLFLKLTHFKTGFLLPTPRNLGGGGGEPI